MKKLFMLIALSCACASADPLLQILPQPAGQIQGTAGQDTGWGFQLLGDPVFWVSVTGSQLVVESDPSLGFYTDLIGLQGGPSSGALSPNGFWQQSFDANLGTGLGFYSILPNTPSGLTNNGTLWVFYEYFSADPSSCGGTCLAGSGILSSPFSVTVSTVPEPGGAALVLTALVLLVRRLK